jgi:branched-chain amino acid transport system substrate-binding protein
MAKLVTAVIAIALMVIAGLAIFGGTESSAQAVIVGFIQPLSSPAVSYGTSELRAIQIAIEEINAAGGVLNGKELKLETQDGICDQGAAGTAAKKLIASTKLIIGGICPEETLAAATVTDALQALFISPGAADQKVSAAGDFVFQTYPSDANAASIAAKYAYESLQVKKAALITELTDHTGALREAYSRAFTDLGGRLVADETFQSQGTDFQTQILKIKSLKPDLIFVVSDTVAPGILLFKQMREIGIPKAKFMTTMALLDSHITSENAAALEGVMSVEPMVDWDTNPKAVAFREAHRAKFGSDPGMFAANAYDAVYLIRDAIEATQSANPIKIKNWLYTVRDWDGAAGNITIDANGDPVMSEHVREVKAGEVIDLGAYTPL